MLEHRAFEADMRPSKSLMDQTEALMNEALDQTARDGKIPLRVNLKHPGKIRVVVTAIAADAPRGILEYFLMSEEERAGKAVSFWT